MSTIKNIPVKLTSLLLSVFFFSGFAALMYQVAWQRILTLYYGVGAVSTTLIVSVYMFGLGFGALLGGFLAERAKEKLFLYFVIELLIGCFGLLSLQLLDFLGRYTAGSSYTLSFFYMFLFLSIPTMLMGITLPLLTKIFNRLIQNFLDTVSLLYFINTIGAAVGSVFASYVVISFFGLDSAVYFAAAVNFMLAFLIFLAKYVPSGQDEDNYASRPQNDHKAILGRVAYVLVFVTGFLAIGYEIAWFRIIGVLVKASPYAFSSVLSVYLLGIALGSFSMSKYLKKNSSVDKRSLFFIIQFLIGFTVIVIIAGYCYLTQHTFLSAFTRESFYIELHPNYNVTSPQSLEDFLRAVYSLIDVFLWPFLFVFIPTFLMGASFPLISLLALSQRNKEGQTVGTIYFFNIAGNVVGGIITGFLLLPYLGTEITVLGFSLVGIFMGLFIREISGRYLTIVKRVILTLIFVIVAVTFSPKKGELYETMHMSPGDEFESYFEEGRDGTIMTYQHNERVWNYINGLMHGTRPLVPAYVWTMNTISYAPKAENILIIGYGTGSVTEAFLKSNEVRKVTLVELNDSLIRNLKKMKIFREMLADNRVELIIDDGRRYLLRTQEKYDIVIIDPLRSTTSYSNNLYSREFFGIVKQHLNKGGIFTLVIDEYRVMPKTVMSEFDFVNVNRRIVITASNLPLNRDDNKSQIYFGSLSDREQTLIRDWLAEASIKEQDAEYMMDKEYLNKLLAGYPINEDWKPVTEYYIGLKTREKFFIHRGK